MLGPREGGLEPQPLLVPSVDPSKVGLAAQREISGQPPMGDARILGPGRNWCRVQNPTLASFGSKNSSDELGLGHRGVLGKPELYILLTLSIYVPSSREKSDENLCSKELNKLYQLSNDNSL